MFNGQAKSGRKWVSVCPECLGEGCQICGFRKFVQHTKPPEEGLTDEGTDLFHSYVWMKNYNQSPLMGGMLQQPARFVKAVNFCDWAVSETNRLKKDQEDNVKDFLDSKGLKNAGKHS